MAAKYEGIKAWLGTGSINIFGMPFAGKDTHGRRLAKLFDTELIGGGEIIRNSAPLHMREHIAAGLLTPIDEYLELILPYLGQTKFVNKPIVLNSVGRWFGEHIHVQEAAKASGHEIKVALFINIGVPELHKRWEHSLHLQDRGQRHDDAEHVLQTRIDEFEAKTLPVVEYYRSVGLLEEIPGGGTQEETFQEILAALERRAKNKAGSKEL